MLNEHLSQAHDAASRRAAIIDRHVSWIHGHLLRGAPSRILDLGCGPGLYSSPPAPGLPSPPASIAPARQQAATAKLNCTYTQADIRQADYGSGHDLVMLV